MASLAQTVQIRQRSKEKEKAEVAASGGPEGWLRSRARELLPLFPGGLAPSEFFGESLDGWLDAAERAKQCARCPPEGGACENSQNAWPDGEIIVPDEQKGIRSEPCKKWQAFVVWRTLGAGNVPEPFRTLTPLSELPDMQHVEPRLAEARRSGVRDWYFVTGGDARAHRHALVTLAYELGINIYKKGFWYDWSARVAVGLREHMNDGDELDLRHKLRTVPVLALDNVNPTAWKPWFIEAIDEILYARAGRATIIASSKSVAELAEKLPLTCAVLESAIEVRLG
jgi:hypothetical protein